jgi:thiol:disulfide interchange protein
MQQDSPLYPVLIQSIIDNMNLSNREELIATMKQASQVDPQQQQMQQQMQQAQMQAQIAFQNAQTAALEAQAQEAMARAQKYAIESQMLPQELELDKLKAITTNLQQGESDDREFERRLKVADRLLKEKEIDLRNRGGQASDNTQPVQPNDTAGQQQVLRAIQQATGAGGQV